MCTDKISAIAALLLSFSILPGSVQAEYSGGTGTPEDPYLISTPEDMNQIGHNYTDWDKCFKLTADINLSAYTGTQFSRIGPDDRHAFSGVFDGNEHTISGFTYTTADSDYIGVFGNISAAGRVENISLVDINVTGHNYVGGLAGYNEGTISNCSSTGSASGSQYIGGLAGYNYGNISDCYSTGAVSGGNGLGGLVGQNGGDISDCCSTDAVTGGDESYYLGGLVGYNYGDISNCNSTGVVTGGHHSYYLGGLVGHSYGTIGNCDSTGAVTGGDYSYYLGGLVGHSYGAIGYCDSTGTVTGGDYSYYLGGLVGQSSNSNISNCYSTGIVTGGYDSDYFGGLAGYVYYGYVTDCYATSEVAGGNDVGGLVGMNESSAITRCYSSGSVSGYMYVGGLVGWNSEGTTTDSFWDTNTSGQSWSDGGTGKTTAEMKTKSTFTDAEWNFLITWDINEEQTYPFFKSGVGTGTPDDPYRIATAEDLLAMAADTSYYDKCFILTADINMQGQAFTMAIIASGNVFTGTFDGNDHKITNFTIDGNDYLGLFGRISYGSSVKKLSLEDFMVSGSQYVGGLVGYNNSGSISNCYSTGAVSGSACLGGLVGYNNSGNISNCYSTGTVSGGNEVGGLVGHNDNGNISDCYSTGMVSGASYVSGLVGDNYGGSISNCYSTGATSGAYYVGGLVGYHYYGDVNNCYSTGAASGIYHVGGLVGVNGGSISGCYSTGNITAGDEPHYLGGLVGDNYYGDVNNCYSTGNITVGDGPYYIGGLAGHNYGTIGNCCFLDVAGPNNGLGTPLTDGQMKQQSNFVDWDFNDVWAICEGTNYPRLLWSIPAADLACPDGVNFVDYSFFAQRWLNTDCASNNNCDGTDFDFSGTMDIADLAIICEHWLKGF